MRQGYFISVDWGSTNFRMRMVDKITLQVIEELRAPVGVRTLYARSETEGGDREAYFVRFLGEQYARFTHPVPADTVMMISGMASSDIGLRELAYAPVPAGLDGSGFHIARLHLPGCPFEIRLVSGLCSDHDLMRGEEVQVLGLASALKLTGKTVLVLPGTHSKHVSCNKQEILDFTTYFTGEMFEVLAEHSILKGSVEMSGADVSGSAAFAEGVRTSLAGVPLLHAVFRVRVRDRLTKREPRENALYLSGIVIGSELSALEHTESDQIWICAGKGLGAWYGEAIGLSPLKQKSRIIPEQTVETAVIKGHALLLDRA